MKVQELMDYIKEADPKANVILYDNGTDTHYRTKDAAMEKGEFVIEYDIDEDEIETK